MKLSRWLVLVVGLLFAPGCANTHITSSWKAADIPSRGYRNIMVAGIIRDTDRSLRAAMEQHLADDLRSRGYTAFSCLERHGPGRFRGMAETEAARLLKADGVDAVLTIVLLDKKKEQHYLPPR